MRDYRNGGVSAPVAGHCQVGGGRRVFERVRIEQLAAALGCVPPRVVFSRVALGTSTHAVRAVEERSDMYAVIKTGGKQYKVAAGENIKVELIDANVGDAIVLDKVLAVGSGDQLKVGAPWVDGAERRRDRGRARQA